MLCTYLHLHHSIPPINQSIYLSIYLSIYPCLLMSIYISLQLFFVTPFRFSKRTFSKKNPLCVSLSFFSFFFSFSFLFICCIVGNTRQKKEDNDIKVSVNQKESKSCSFVLQRKKERKKEMFFCADTNQSRLDFKITDGQGYTEILNYIFLWMSLFVSLFNLYMLQYILLLPGLTNTR